MSRISRHFGLSHTLLDLGFFSAFGTSEEIGIGDREFVRCGKPYTISQNNGVLAVYDEKGRPWIIRTRDVSTELITNLEREFDLRRGAYVPHSNDSGHFLLEVLPSLQS